VCHYASDKCSLISAGKCTKASRAKLLNHLLYDVSQSMQVSSYRYIVHAVLDLKELGGSDVEMFEILPRD